MGDSISLADQMTFKEKRETVADPNPEALLADGFEEALIGYAEVFNKVIAVYDRDRCMQLLMERDGMTFDEACNFFNYNVTGAYAGEHTPAFLTRFE